ncbi:TPA: hypothetical protein N0F65_010773 [Lagenidium giganteum]|uniref:Uncharacterized protein n=1 Tax=Lagenidium giganteum TaxID=4803 RepID=A0AAV2YVT2_9STRA|nr:TPA: hypothetical protein N0F65_010773 [Lagenidium giganteum]
MYHDQTYWLPYLAGMYSVLWLLLALASTVSMTRKFKAFREIRRVDRINLTTLPFCLRNYMALANVVLEFSQLTVTSLTVWRGKYALQPVVSALALLDGGRGDTASTFHSKQTASVICLVIWWLCLKAANKFKALPWFNYLLTNAVPNVLSGPLFLCPVAQLNNLLAAALAYGSNQVFFPEMYLDVQTAPLINVCSQLVKACIMGSLAFFAEAAPLYLGVALLGNLLLFSLVLRYRASCSSCNDLVSFVCVAGIHTAI